MKRLTLVLFLMIGLVAFVNAQHEQGQINANIGVGIGSSFSAGSLSLPPLSVSVDYGYSDQISIGGYIGYVASKEDFAFLNYSWKYTYMIVGVRGAYHLDLVDGIDTYGGILLGYNIASVKYEGSMTGIPEPKVGGIAYAGFVGGRYHFSEKIGAFAELGYGITFLNLGLTFKM